ncbi:hypothetical protein DFH08DRAFT_873235 [Mycena albidolilacea]|uniref:Uncharacterized protein n=1 Tax=Mycena albidolilacea TaxID=1033008 RepID=A0AAD7EPV2_9AGAR|nr:hypothetical protein DFH08DRAFT_873235 [Mycena albidolilacea]
MLEIEMQSPSFRTTRSVSAKRARSPDSPSERPAKRLSLAIGGTGDVFHYFGAGARSSASTSRHSSEDWVQQAGVLSIDSPLFRSTSAAPEDASPDEGMLVDEDATTSRRPYLPPLRTQSDTLMQPGFAPAPPPLHAQAQQPLNHPSGSGYNATTPIHTGSGALFLPAINILPATPDLLSRTRPSTPVHADRDNSSAMSISPTNSYAVLGSPASKKQRFMMGPRANCEKCRLGVKGHWVHLD